MIFDSGQPLDLLQWGRRFLTAETSIAKILTRAGFQASMGPPFFDGGNQHHDFLS